MASLYSFGTVDYIVFAGTIVLSLGVGIYSALSGGKQKTTQEFLVGNRDLKVLPVTLSLIVSYESSIMMLGIPGEMYTYGAQFWWTNVSWCVAMLLVALIMVPTFYKMRILSVYEFLEMRFSSRGVRLVGSVLGVMTNLWYMGIVLYGPATALEAVTGFQMWYSVALIAVVAMAYTAIGGIKAVILTDAIQSIIMIGGMIAIIVKGTIDAGGVKNVYDISMQGKRLEFFNFDLDPTIRLTFWGVTIGSIFRLFGIGTNQTTVQRIATMPTLKKAQLITILSGPGFLAFGTLACLEGLVAYAYYTTRNCDLLKAGIVENPNQIIPYFVMELFHDLPGLPGLFLAALFSAALSTLSSGFASISAIVWSDYIKPHAPNTSESRATIIAKMLVIVSGIISVGVAVLVMQVGGPMNQISATILAAFTAPLAGLFLLGGLLPNANNKGAYAAVICSSAFSFWISFGSSFSPEVTRTQYLPGPSIDNCSSFNVTTLILPSTTPPVDTTSPSPSILKNFYSISFLWISTIAMLISLVVGTIVSYATGGRNKDDIDEQYLMPVCERIFCCLPNVIRSRFTYNPKSHQKGYVAPLVDYRPEHHTNENDEHRRQYASNHGYS